MPGEPYVSLARFTAIRPMVDDYNSRTYLDKCSGIHNGEYIGGRNTSKGSNILNVNAQVHVWG